jgi:hypothetical protein
MCSHKQHGASCISDLWLTVVPCHPSMKLVSHKTHPEHKPPTTDQPKARRVENSTVVTSMASRTDQKDGSNRRGSDDLRTNHPARQSHVRVLLRECSRDPIANPARTLETGRKARAFGEGRVSSGIPCSNLYVFGVDPLSCPWVPVGARGGYSIFSRPGLRMGESTIRRWVRATLRPDGGYKLCRGEAGPRR